MKLQKFIYNKLTINVWQIPFPYYLYEWFLMHGDWSHKSWGNLTPCFEQAVNKVKTYTCRITYTMKLVVFKRFNCTIHVYSPFKTRKSGVQCDTYTCTQVIPLNDTHKELKLCELNVLKWLICNNL